MAYIVKDWDLFFNTIEILAYLFVNVVPFFTILRRREFDILWDLFFCQKSEFKYWYLKTSEVNQMMSHQMSSDVQ